MSKRKNQPQIREDDQTFPYQQAKHQSPDSDSSSDTCSTEYVLVNTVPSTTNCCSSSIDLQPTYHFPGTWTKALHDTTHALHSISSASKAFGAAVATSGIVEAGWSVGGALAVTASTGARAVTGFAVAKTGTDTEKLPGVLKGWLERGQKGRDKRKRNIVEQRIREQHAGRGESSHSTSRTSCTTRRFSSTSRGSVEAHDNHDSFEFAHGSDGYNHLLKSHRTSWPSPPTEPSPYISNQQSDAAWLDEYDAAFDEDDNSDKDEQRTSMDIVDF